MARDGRRPGASPSWPCGIWGWGRGALRTEFKRTRAALWRSWEKPMVGESMLYNSDLNKLLLQWRPWKHFRSGRIVPMDHDCQPFLRRGRLWRRGSQRKFCIAMLIVWCTPMVVHSVGLKTTYHTFSEPCFHIRNNKEHFWIISWKSEKTIFFSWHKYGWSILEHFSRE